MATAKRPASRKVTEHDQRNEDFLIEILEWHVNAGDVFSKGNVLCSVNVHQININSINVYQQDLNFKTTAWSPWGSAFGSDSSEPALKPGKQKIKASFEGVFIKALVSAGEKVKPDSVLAKIYSL